MYVGRPCLAIGTLLTQPPMMSFVFFLPWSMTNFLKLTSWKSHSVSQFHSLFIEKGHDNYNQHFANKKTTAHRLLFSFHVLEQSGSPNQKKMVVLSTSTSSGHLGVDRVYSNPKVWVSVISDFKKVDCFSCNFRKPWKTNLFKKDCWDDVGKRGLRKEGLHVWIFHWVLYLYNKTPKLTNDIRRV